MACAFAGNADRLTAGKVDADAVQAPILLIMNGKLCIMD